MQRTRDALRRAVDPALAVFTALLLGAIVIVLTDIEHLGQLGTDPLAAIGGALASVVDGYGAMFAGAIGNPSRIVAAIQSGTTKDIAAAMRPLPETLISATPFILGMMMSVITTSAGALRKASTPSAPLRQVVTWKPALSRTRRSAWLTSASSSMIRMDDMGFSLVVWLG